jgi:uncharacterized membrane protein YcaP (DUF421 family)
MLELDPLILGGIVLRTLAVYFVLLLGLRLAGKRELGQLSVFDLVVVLVIANAVQNAMVGPDTSLTGGLVAALTLLAANAFVGRVVSRASWLELRVRGTPTLLLNDGQLITEHLRQEGLTADEVMMAMREHGFDNFDDAKIAVLEVDGTISVVPRNATVHRTRRRVRGRKPAG